MALSIDLIIERGQALNVQRRMTVVDLRRSVRDLFTAMRVAHIDYTLVGGVALLAYVAGRNTQDIDLIVDPAAITMLDWQATLSDADFGRARYGTLDVDLLLTTNPIFDYVRHHERTEIEFDGEMVMCATRAGLILLKLYALPSLYRQGNLARAALYETDLLMLLQAQDVDSEALLAVLARHVSSRDIEELRRVIVELRTRRRFT